MFSHGKPGHLYLEGEWRNIKQIKEWFDSKLFLEGKKHINIYGCEFAKGLGGKMAIDYLSKQFGVTVAASDDTTGIDGDWELEVGIPRDIIQIPSYSSNLGDMVGLNHHIFIDEAISDLKVENHTYDPEVFHLFSHGKPGHLLIEGEWKNVKQIKLWLDKHNYLKAKKHLNIYGCEFAKGIGGKMDLEYLSKQLGITLAASNDTTGVDGDWELEVGIPKNLIQVPAYQGNLQTATNTGNNTGLSGFYSWSDFSYNNATYEGFCIEYYDDVPNTGDVFSPSSTSPQLSSSEEAQVAAAMDAMDDETLGSKTARYTYIAYAIWSITDGLDPSYTSYETEVNLILTRISNGTYTAPANTYFGANQSSSSRQDMVFAPSTPDDNTVSSNSGTSGFLHTGTFSHTFAFSNSVVPGTGISTYSDVDGTDVDVQFAWDNPPPSLSAFHDNGSYSGLSSANFWTTSGMGNNTHTLEISFSGGDEVTALGFDMVHINESGGGGDKITFSALTESGASITPAFTQPSDPDYTLVGSTADATEYDVAPEYNLGVNFTASSADPIASISIAWAECSTCPGAYHGVGMSDIHFQSESSATSPPTSTVDTDGDGVYDVDDLDDDNDGILDEIESCGESQSSSGQTITVEVKLDNYASETTWTLQDASGTTVLSGGPYSGADNNALKTANYSNASGSYTFTISDQYNDGICCNYGNGYYEIKVDGATVAGGSNSGNGNFGASATESIATSGGSSAFSCVGGDPSGDEDGDGTLNYQDADFCTLNGNGVCSDLDTDGDGIIDQYDTDSDGDGCADAIEGDGAFTISDIDVNDRLTASVNSQGIPGGSSQGIGDSQDAGTESAECSVTDTDGDGVADALDLDDDNDGILDTDEDACSGVQHAISASQSGGASFETNAVGAIDAAGTYATTSNSGYVRTGDVIYLTLPTEVPAGDSVTLSMARRNNNGAITVTDEGTGSLYVGSGDWGSTNYLQRFTFVITASTNVLTFTRYSGSVWINGVEYCSSSSDTDNDGIVNSLDTDSDGDGCADAIEGGGNFTSADLDNNDRLSGEIDAYGVPIAAGSSGQSLGTAQDRDNKASACNLTALAGTDVSICTNASTDLAGSASDGDGDYSYSWSPTAGLSASNIANPTASPTSTTSYVLTVTDGQGLTDQDTVIVTVASEVIADAGSDVSITQGNNTTLNGSGTGGDGNYTYSWTPSTGLSSSSIAQPTASPATTTTYALVLTDGNACKDTAEVTVGVMSEPLEPEVIGGTPDTDLDNDGVTDFADLDDDNDGILDRDEGAICVGYVNYEFYDVVPAGYTVDNIPTTGALAEGITDEINISALLNTHTPDDGNTFSIRYKGRIYIDSTETFTFYLNSDDGSKLIIDGNEIVDNDGDHPPIEKSGDVTLGPGYHSFELTFYENGGGEVLTWSYSTASVSKQTMPMSLLTPTSCSGRDTDEDGSFDYVDTDSDNDGCPDATEGSAEITLDDLSSNDRISGSIDAQGIPTKVSGGQSDQGSRDSEVVSSACTQEKCEFKAKTTEE